MADEKRRILACDRAERIGTAPYTHGGRIAKKEVPVTDIVREIIEAEMAATERAVTVVRRRCHGVTKESSSCAYCSTLVDAILTEEALHG